jgi:hypothetical protein
LVTPKSKNDGWQTMNIIENRKHVTSRCRRLLTSPRGSAVALLLLLFCCSVTPSGAQTTKKYPPYPDVWGVELPVSKDVKYTGIHVFRTLDGDFMVVYAKSRVRHRGEKWTEFAGKEIFSGRVRKFKPGPERDRKNDYNVFFEEMEGMMFRDRSVIFADGTGISELGDRFDDVCTPFWGYLAMTDKNRNELSGKLILYLYDKHIKMRVDPSHCESHWNYEGEFYYQGVHSLEEMTYHTVDDNTFLVFGTLRYQDPPSVVAIRFDKNWNTKSDLVGRKVFVVDKDVYDDLWEKHNSEPAVNEAMYEYLLKIRKEGE